MTAITRLRLLRVVLVLVLIGGVAWLVSEERVAEAVGLMLLGALRERETIAAFLSGRRARNFEGIRGKTEFHTIAVPGGWSATTETDGLLHTVRLEGRGAWLRATWIEAPRDVPAIELARPLLEKMREKFTCADERTIATHLAAFDAEGVEATLSTWRTLGRLRAVAAKVRGGGALLVCAYWGWGVPDDVIERCFLSVELCSSPKIDGDSSTPGSGATPA